MWPELLANAETGELWIRPSTAIEGRDAIDNWLDVLKRMQHESKLIQLSGDSFSTLPSALQLAAKYDKKITDPDAGLSARLRQFIEVGEQLRELFLLSIKRVGLEDTATQLDLDKLALKAKLPTPAGG